MNFLKKGLRSLKRAVLGDDESASDDELHDEDGYKKSRMRGRRRARTPVIESAVSELSGIAHGGVQGFNWVAERAKMDDDGDVADEFIVYEDDDRSAVKSTTKTTKGKGKKK